MNHYYFTIRIHGTGKTDEEAWDHACEGFAQDPGSVTEIDPEDIEKEDDDDEQP